MNRINFLYGSATRQTRSLKLSHPLTQFHFRLGSIYPNLGRRRLSRVRLVMNGHGDLNNTHTARVTTLLEINPEYSHKSLAIGVHEDEVHIREQYRPFLLPKVAEDDWAAKLELATTLKMVESEILNKKQDRLRILVLYGSLRNR